MVEGIVDAYRTYLISTGAAPERQKLRILTVFYAPAKTTACKRHKSPTK